MDGLDVDEVTRTFSSCQPPALLLTHLSIWNKSQVVRFGPGSARPGWTFSIALVSIHPDQSVVYFVVLCCGCETPWLLQLKRRTGAGHVVTLTLYIWGRVSVGVRNLAPHLQQNFIHSFSLPDQIIVFVLCCCCCETIWLNCVQLAPY